MAYSQDANQGIRSQTNNLCLAGCGFYGAASMDGFCSKCYKERIQTREDQQLASQAASSATSDVSTVIGAAKITNNPTLSSNKPDPKPIQLIEDEVLDNELPPSTNTPEGASKPDIEVTPEAQKKKRNRCEVCHKRVGLTGFTCRCKRLFCSEHQYPDEHSCEIDYKQLGRDQLTKANPVVVAEKIKKL